MAKVYTEQLHQELNAERAALGKEPIEEENDDENKGFGSGTKEKTVSTTKQ